MNSCIFSDEVLFRYSPSGWDEHRRDDFKTYISHRDPFEQYDYLKYIRRRWGIKVHDDIDKEYEEFLKKTEEK